MDARSSWLRALVVRALISAGHGHVGPSFSLIEILRVLYDDILKFRSNEPLWPLRDRLILSKGHGCLALYAILADKGYFDLNLLDTFNQSTSSLGGHPERGMVPGVEASTGSLGHGLPIGVGIARALQIKKSPARVFVIVGDGELNEGSIWEALLLSNHHTLSNLTLLIDCNDLQCFGPTKQVLKLHPLEDKLRSFGWQVNKVDGHDIAALKEALSPISLRRNVPSAIVCKTVKGRGCNAAEDQASWHYKYHFSEQEYFSLLNIGAIDA